MTKEVEGHAVRRHMDVLDTPVDAPFDERQKLIDSRYDGDEQRYLDSAKALHSLIWQHLENSYPQINNPRLARMPSYATRTFTHVRWLEDEHAPIRAIGTSPTSNLTGVVVTPTGITTARLHIPDEEDLLHLSSGDIQHPAVGALELRLHDPRYTHLIEPTVSSLEFEASGLKVAGFLLPVDYREPRTTI